MTRPAALCAIAHFVGIAGAISQFCEDASIPKSKPERHGNRGPRSNPRARCLRAPSHWKSAEYTSASEVHAFRIAREPRDGECLAWRDLIAVGVDSVTLLDDNRARSRG